MKVFKKYAQWVSVLLGLVGLVLFLVLDAASYTIDGGFLGSATTSFKGYEITFGLSREVLGSGAYVQVLNASVLSIITLVVLLIAMILGVIASLGKGKKLLYFVSIVTFIVAGVLFFLTGIGVTFPNLENPGYVPAIGAILGGVLSILGGLVLVPCLFGSKKKKR